MPKVAARVLWRSSSLAEPSFVLQAPTERSSSFCRDTPRLPIQPPRAAEWLDMQAQAHFSFTQKRCKKKIFWSVVGCLFFFFWGKKYQITNVMFSNWEGSQRDCGSPRAAVQSESSKLGILGTLSDTWNRQNNQLTWDLFRILLMMQNMDRRLHLPPSFMRSLRNQPLLGTLTRYKHLVSPSLTAITCFQVVVNVC